MISRDGVLTLVDTRGHIKTMKAADGKSVVDMKIDLQSGAAARPSAAGKLFVVPTLNGAINLVDPKDGSIIWRYMVHPQSEEAAARMRSRRGQTGATGRGGVGGGGGAGGGLGGLGGGAGIGGGGAGIGGGGGFGGGEGAGGGQGGGQGLGQTGANGQSQFMGSGGIDRPDPANYSVQAAGPATVVGDTLLLLGEDGSLLAFDKNTGVDVTGPEIHMVYPAAGSEVNSDDLGLAFRISDDASGVKDSTITVTANGKPVDHEFTADGLDTVRFNLHGKNDLLPDGRVEFVVTASDWLGNVTTAKFSLTIDNTLPKLYQPKIPNQGGAGGAGGGGFGGGGGGGRGGGGGIGR